MNELLKVSYNSDRPTVSARELYNFLDVDTRYNDWFSRMCKYGFEEGKDFYSFLSKNQNGGRPKQDAQLTIEAAKEISMLQRNEKGKMARQYFIELEKRWNSPEMIMKRALEFANAKVQELEGKVEADKPKVLFADSVSASKTSILISELAKLLRQNGIETGQKRLFEWLRENGYLIKRRGSERNLPTQKAMEMKLFEIKETVITHSNGVVTVNRTPIVTGKGQVYFINKFLAAENAS